jgi:5' nucleotidase, deoxy (Pyrimidine), cytosolic type C protein (NT5C)
VILHHSSTAHKVDAKLPIIGVDLDGVLHDFTTSFAAALHSIGHVKAPLMTFDPVDVTWDFYTEWGFTRPEFLEAFRLGALDGTVFNGPPYYGSIEPIRDLYSLGYEIRIISSRIIPGVDPELSLSLTKEWMHNHNVPYDVLALSSDKSCLPTDAFLDDLPANYDQLAAAGCTAYLLDRPWNQDDSCTRLRVYSVEEFSTTIKRKK